MSSTESNFFLIDCNQFFVSCELLFRPNLRGKPVVVLSSNDGCVVSRSKEAKALGIPMGAPAFQHASLFKEKNVHVFSSNFTLYAEMSRRVMSTLYQFPFEVEEYSIDEAFLLVESNDPLQIAEQMREKILKWTGIPASIGIGATKTLSKVANDLAKNRADCKGIFALRTPQEIENCLKDVPVKEIWGIGPQLSRRMGSLGIWTALQLAQAEESWIKKQLSVSILQTVLELRGIRCLSLDDMAPAKQSITRSRSFEKPLFTLSDLSEALSSHVARAAEKLREQQSHTSALLVYLRTSHFIKESYCNSASVLLSQPTDYTPLLITEAKKALEAVYRPGHPYKKVGVVLGNLTANDCLQLDLFAQPSPLSEKKKRAMEVMDDLNETLNKKVLLFAAEGVEKNARTKCAHRSHRFVTRWDELLTI